MSQSQFSRREKGEIDFTVKELLKLAKELEVSISELLGDKSNSFQVNNMKGGNFAQFILTNDKLIEQLEKRLKEKDEYIALLKSKNE